jgi:hypothetical protein
MFIFVLLNLICLSIILAKFIWHSENSRRETARYVNKLFGVPKTELDIIREEQDAEELNHTCDHCNDGCDTDDDSTHDSIPELVEDVTADDNVENIYNEETKVEKTDKVDKIDKIETTSETDVESDDVSIEHVSVQDLDVIKETLGFIQKTKDMLFEIKSDLEKKID